jgi:hypothetical protein
MRVVRAQDLTGLRGPPADRLDTDDQAIIELSSDDAASLGRFWGLVLLLATQYRAASLHYHPWRSDGGLAFIVGNTRYILIPPGGLTGPIVAAARSLFVSEGPLTRWFAKCQSGVTGSFAFDVWGQLFEWDVVCWTSGPRCGVEFFRVTPPADPGAAGLLV